MITRGDLERAGFSFEKEYRCEAPAYFLVKRLGFSIPLPDGVSDAIEKAREELKAKMGIYPAAASAECGGWKWVAIWGRMYAGKGVLETVKRVGPGAESRWLGNGGRLYAGEQDGCDWLTAIGVADEMMPLTRESTMEDVMAFFELHRSERKEFIDRLWDQEDYEEESDEEEE